MGICLENHTIMWASVVTYTKFVFLPSFYTLRWKGLIAIKAALIILCRQVQVCSIKLVSCIKFYSLKLLGVPGCSVGRASDAWSWGEKSSPKLSIEFTYKKKQQNPYWNKKLFNIYLYLCKKLRYNLPMGYISKIIKHRNTSSTMTH